MRNGPLNYLRMRLARSIESRVSTATRIASDELRQEMTAHVDQLVAEQRADQERLAGQETLAEQHRLLLAEVANLAQRLDEVIRIADDDRGSARDLLGQLADAQKAASNSVGSISASLTDAQRRQADFVEQLARRIEALEQSAQRTPEADTAEPGS